VSALIASAKAKGYGQGGASIGRTRSLGGVKGAKTRIKSASGHTAGVATAWAPLFVMFINDLENTGYRINYLGGQRTDADSWHHMGNAIDINKTQNPMETPKYKKVDYGSYSGTGKPNSSQNFGIIQPLGRDGRLIKTDMPANIEEIAARYGLGWGGTWGRKNNKGEIVGKCDAMHFSVGSNETQWRGTAGVNIAMSELGSLVLTAELMGLSTGQANALGNETWKRSRLARRYARTMIKKGKFMGDFVNVPSNGQWGTNLATTPSNTSLGPLPAAGTGMGGWRYYNILYR